MCSAAVWFATLLPGSMDRASRVLAGGIPPTVPRSYRALTDQSGVPRSNTPHSRARGRQSIEAKSQGEQYLTLSEEQAVVDFVLHMSVLGYPVREELRRSIRIRPDITQPMGAHESP
ncbi:hypothetical protein F5B18DRAFT_623439 [Nemania serpens]|nr:hypothetical protein F5B18DRAFT_623439 [Nemania serpens]